MMKKMIRNSTAEFLIFTSQMGGNSIEVLVKDETVWLTQKLIAELFDVNVPAISKHLNNIYKEGELDREGTLSILETVQNEGGRDVKRDEREILDDHGKVTAKIAKECAESEFEKYRIVQDRLFESDFDKMIKEIEKK